MKSKHPPAVEMYLRETDRYKAFLVGHRPGQLSADKSQGLAWKIEDWERRWSNSTHTGGENHRMLFNSLIAIYD